VSGLRSDRVRRLTDAPARVRAWFLGGSWGADLAWGAAALALVAVLAWFFILSPYGAPAAPVYAEF